MNNTVFIIRNSDEEYDRIKLKDYLIRLSDILVRDNSNPSHPKIMTKEIPLIDRKNVEIAEVTEDKIEEYKSQGFNLI